MIAPTDEQSVILAAPLTPIRIAAGAGTGKTTTIALRVVHLVTQHRLDPERILGLTFTNKAAAELSDRIRHELAGYVEPGREVEVHTYHGFAAQVLREFGALVGVERNAQVITPTFSRQLLTGVLASTPLPAISIASLGAVEDLRRLGSSLGDHLLEPSDVEIPPHGGDDPWTLRADLLKGLSVYQQEKRRLGVTDYSDLVVKAHRLVTSHPDIASEIRGRYRAVMLDEYQDTNPAQREFLRVLFPPGSAVTAVGDVDQTIYEWRGASPHNFEHFPEHFPSVDGTPARTLQLTENRRSLPNIIAVANTIREMTGSGQSALVPLADRTGGEVVVSWHDDAVAEANWIASRLELLHEVHQWRDMAVLFRKNKDMILVHDALRAAGIPVEVANLGGLLGVPEVADLHAWLSILQRPEDAPSLYRILMGSRFRLGMGDLVHLSIWVARSSKDDEHDPDLFEHGEIPPRTLLEAIDHLDQLPGLRGQARAALSRFIAEYRELLTAAQGVSLVELCRRILDRTGAWNDLAALPDAEQLTARLNIYRFLDLTEEWSPLEGRPSLASFLSYLALMQQDQTEELDTARLSGEDAVTLLTVHRAKGLEWEAVFIPACYRSNFPSQSHGFENPYNSGRYLPYELRLDRQWLPPLNEEVDKETADDLLREVHVRQEWRIAYVAATRAKQRLFVSGAYWYGHPEPRTRPVTPSELWHLVRQHPIAQVESEPKDPPRAPTLLRYEPDESAPDPLFPEGWAAALRAELASPGWAAELASGLGLEEACSSRTAFFQRMLFELPVPVARPPEAVETSVTGLVTYATCPKRYYWSYVDRLPRRPNPAARRGTEVHRQIELHHRGQIPFDELSQDLYDLPHWVGETPQVGKDPIQEFSKSRFAQAKPLLIEAPFEIGKDGLRIRGRIDAVYEPSPDTWEIVDFKSGRAISISRMADTTIGVQLEAYAIAAASGALGRSRPQQMKVTLAFLGDGLEQVSEDVDDIWLEGAHNKLAGLASGINQERWDPAPSEACSGCDFLRFCGPGRALVGSMTRPS